jgi:hypothetical protein
LLTDQRAEGQPPRFSHSGERFVLGYGTDFFGIWDRSAGASLVARFPRDDAGWEQAWKQFVGWERRFIDVTGPMAEPTVSAAPAPAFRPASGWARITAAMLGVTSVLALLTIAARAGLIARLHEFQRGATSGAGVVEAGGAVDGLAFGTIGAVLITAFVWLIWQHRVHKNLHSLGRPGLRFSPAAAVWWWFVPVANFVMPFRAVRELWNASTSHASGSDDVVPGAPLVLVAWWAFCLARIPLGAVAAAVSPERSLTPNELLRLTWLGMAGDAVLVIAGALAVAVVMGVERRHRALLGAPRPVPAEPAVEAMTWQS